MADTKDPKSNLTDDLLEGFDDSFDDQIEDPLLEAEDPNKTSVTGQQFIEDIKKPSTEKTEFAYKGEEKTEVVSKFSDSPDDPLDDFGDDLSPLTSASELEPTRTAIAQPPKASTEDLSSLINDELPLEGRTEDQTVYESTRNSDQPRIPTEDLSSLMDPNAVNFEGGEGKTEMQEGKTEDLASMIDSDLLEASQPYRPSASQEHKPKTSTSDLSSLIEEGISGEHEGKTEDLSSLISGEMEDEIPLTVQPQKPAARNFPEPPRVQAPSKSVSKKESSSRPADQEEKSMDFVKSEQSETKKVWNKPPKHILMIGAAVGVLIVIGAAGFIYKKVKSDLPSEEIQQQAQVVDSEQLMKELDEKYAQTPPYYLPDRFQGYSDAAGKLQEIVTTYPNHKKANARLAETILLKFDGYLDGDKKNKVYQLLEKAETVDSNSVGTLRAKARLLMVEGKVPDALVRIDQALNLDPNDPDTLQTLGEIKLANKDAKGALDAFMKVQELQPQSVRAKYFHYLALEKQKNYKEADAGFAEIAPDTSGHPRSFIERYAIGFQQGKFDSTKADLEGYLTGKEGDLSPYEASRGWKLIADEYVKRGDTKNAIESLEKAVGKMALNHEYTFQLGNMYFKQNNFEKASQHYSTSVTLSPENVDYLLQLGISLHKQGRLKEAEEQLKTVVTKEPKNFEGLYQHAYTKYKLGFVDEVVPQLELNIKENPDFLQGRLLLGTIQMEKNDLKNAFNNFDFVLKNTKNGDIRRLALLSMGTYYQKQEMWAKAKQNFQQALVGDPENYDINNALAKISVQLGQPAEAEIYLKKILKINPDSVDAKVLQAGILAGKKEYDKAIALYQDVIKARENDFETRIALGKVYLDKDMAKEAVNEFMLAYKYNADYFYTFYYLGIANRKYGDLAESERNLMKAVDLMPKFYKVHYELGLTLLKKEDIKRGTEEMNKALDLEPTFFPALADLGSYYFDRSAFDDANVYFTKALKLQPNNVDLLVKQAKTYRELGNDKKSIAMFQKILQLKPTSAAVYHDLGLTFEENGDYNQALIMYQRAINLAPNEPRHYLQLGFLYKAMRQNVKATGMFKKFLQLNPNAVEKADIEDEIRKLTGN